MKPFYFISLATILISACDKTKGKKFQDLPAETLYNQAYKELVEENFRRALDTFEEVEKQHPASYLAIKAKLMAAYSAYKAKNYLESAEILEHFLHNNPMNKYADYAKYLLALSYYQQIPSIDRDNKKAEEALNAFKDLCTTFPNSIYTKDAQDRINILTDRIAAKEIDIGRRYQKEGAYIAAMIRFNNVLEYYPKTGHATEAATRLIECLKANHMDNLAIKLQPNLKNKGIASATYKKY